MLLVTFSFRYQSRGYEKVSYTNWDFNQPDAKGFYKDNVIVKTFNGKWHNINGTIHRTQSVCEEQMGEYYGWRTLTTTLLYHFELFPISPPYPVLLFGYIVVSATLWP